MAIGKITGSVIADNTLTETNLAFGISGQSAVSSWATDTLKVNILSSDDSVAVTVNDGLIVVGDFMFDGGVSVNTILDEDSMSSNSATALATQQSIKAYVDSVAGGTLSLGDSSSNSGSVDVNGGDNLELRSGDSITATVSGNGATFSLNDDITVNQIGAKDSSDVSITSPLQLSSTLQVAGTTNLNGTTNLQTTTITENTTGDALLLTTTEDSSSAGPVITMKRNSGSPADADYLGQLKFKGENDADQEVVYAKITAKILDASDGSEDGIIEFAHKKAGANVITGRFRSDSLQLLNDTSLTVAGTTTLTGDVTMAGNLSVNTISSDDSSAIQINEGLNVSGTISADTIDVNTLTSGDSSGININETKLYVNGNSVLHAGSGADVQQTTTSSDVSDMLINNSGTVFRIPLANVDISSFNNDAGYAAGGVSGFTNSTVTTFPVELNDSAARDYGDGEPGGVGTGDTENTDAFGVALGTTYDNMEPNGSTQTTDLGSTEAYVGA